MGLVTLQFNPPSNDQDGYVIYFYDPGCEEEIYLDDPYSSYNSVRNQNDSEYAVFHRAYCWFKPTIPYRFTITKVSFKFYITAGAYPVDNIETSTRVMSREKSYYWSGAQALFNGLQNDSTQADLEYIPATWGYKTIDLGQIGIDALNSHRTWFGVSQIIDEDVHGFDAHYFTYYSKDNVFGNWPTLVVEGYRGRQIGG